MENGKSAALLPARPTILDVARLCGLTKGTVSKALNSPLGSKLVSDDTRKKVLDAAESLGYRPSFRGRLLAQKRSQMICVLHSAPSGAVPRGAYWEISDNLESALSEQNYSLTFVHALEAHDRLEQMLSDGRFDGCVSMGMIDPSVLEMVRRCKLPAVLINSAADESWSRIEVDDDMGMEHAMKHLLQLGHRRIIYRFGRKPMAHPSMKRRYDAYCKCMIEAGLEPSKEYVSEAPEFVKQIKQEGELPTAIVDFEHWTAIRLLQALWREGIRVPHDLSLVTFNDTHPVNDVIPPLTTVGLPAEQIARKSVEMILARIEDPEIEPETIVLPEHLVVRESAAVPRTHSLKF